MSLAAKQSPRVEARWRFILAQACSRASVRGQGRGLRVKERCAQRPVYTTFYACAMACARTSRIKRFYAMAFCRDASTTLDDLRGAIKSLEDSERTVRRVLGGAHPFTVQIERFLRMSRAVLTARETPSRSK